MVGPEVRSHELFLGPSNQLQFSKVLGEQNMDLQMKNKALTLVNFPENSS